MNEQNSGLMEFGLRFGGALGANAQQLLEERNFKFYFFIPKSHFGVFGEEVTYIRRNKDFKLINPLPIKFDVWHSLNQFCKVRASIFSKKSCVTIHDLNFLYMNENPGTLERKLRRHTRLIARNTHQICISEFVKNDLEQNISIQKNIKVIYNGVYDLSKIAQVRHHKFVSNRPFFFHISRLADNKNPEAIIRTAEIMPDYDFVIAGDLHNTHAKAQIEYVKSRQIKNVIFLHKITTEEKSWFYANCCGFIFPSLHEGFGLPIIEAMYFGKPVFVSNLSCIPEIAKDKGYYFSNFISEEMKNVILCGLEDFKQRNRYAELVTYAHKFSWENCINNHLNFYDEIINS